MALTYDQAVELENIKQHHRERLLELQDKYAQKSHERKMEELKQVERNYRETLKELDSNACS